MGVFAFFLLFLGQLDAVCSERLNHHRVFNTGDDFNRTAAFTAGFNFDGSVADMDVHETTGGSFPPGEPDRGGRLYAPAPVCRGSLSHRAGRTLSPGSAASVFPFAGIPGAFAAPPPPPD